MSTVTLHGMTLHCLHCKSPLQEAEGAFRCTGCSKEYVHQRGIPCFVPVIINDAKGKGENAFKDFFKRWPFLYRILFWVVGPALLTGLTSHKFARRLSPDSYILHAGSGTHTLAGKSINVDLFPFEGVDIAADIRYLPFADNVFDAVTSEQVLEHVSSPHAAALEFVRVTKQGGLIHVAIPFMFPWHPSPSDYTRWTHEGIADLFPGCSIVEKGISAGPCSAATAFLAAFLATIFSFGIRPLQTVLQYIFLVLLIPLKLLDLLYARLPGAELCAAEVYVVLQKD